MVIDEQKNRRIRRQHKHNALSSAPGDLGPETLGRINQTSSRPLRPVSRDEGAGRVNNTISNEDITPWDHVPMRSCVAEVVMCWCVDTQAFVLPVTPALVLLMRVDTCLTPPPLQIPNSKR